MTTNITGGAITIFAKDYVRKLLLFFRWFNGLIGFLFVSVNEALYKARLSISPLRLCFKKI